MEVVFEPDLKDGEEAAALVKELVTILQRIGTCSCKMEGKREINWWSRFTVDYRGRSTGGR
jgi:Asp-tRNA(Asn)/Glu-tRNA(Gln) amidotransferase B subunit